jgi:hypothetical protein
MLLQMEYKRNQVESAIARVMEPHTGGPSAELHNQLKRLLDTDRAAGRLVRSGDPERANFAFYSAEAPGSGVEVWFSDYESFALMTGLSLLRHSWPQGFAVALMRRIRPQLEAEHERILKLDRAKLFDEKEILRRAKAGDMAFDVTDPVLLTIVSKSGTAREQETVPLAWSLCKGAVEAMKFLRNSGGGPATIFELAGVAHKLSAALLLTKPNRRGRA